MSELLLEATELSCERDERVLFSGLSLQVRQGSLIQVEGPNGAGKTTLLRILSGLHTFYEGRLFWRNEPVESVRESFLANLLYLGHNPGIKPVLTAVENLSASISASRKVSRDALYDALAAAGLAGYEEIPCRQLSAGQHRRVALARLYLSEAPVWILDEAFTAIDRAGVQALENLMLERVRAGGAIVLTTHHPLSLDGLDVLRLGEQGAVA